MLITLVIPVAIVEETLLEETWAVRHVLPFLLFARVRVLVVLRAATGRLVTRPCTT